MKFLNVIFVTSLAVCMWFLCEASSPKTITVMISQEKSYPFCRRGEAALVDVKVKMMENFGKMFNLNIEYVVVKETSNTENYLFDNSSEPMQDS